MEALAGPAVEGSESALEARVLIGELLAKLSPVEREVYLSHAEGWQHPEIARALGITVTMSRLRLSQAKKKLASWLKAER
jgi:DNA-directed RNA polymerase specialized sigma24 family protein